MTTPDHAENTGDNLRHAAEVQEQACDDQTETQLPQETQLVPRISWSKGVAILALKPRPVMPMAASP